MAWKSRERYYIAAPLTTSAPLRDFARLWGISPAQIFHVTHPRHLRGLAEVTVYLRGDWYELHHQLIVELYLMVDQKRIRLDPWDAEQKIHDALERALDHVEKECV